MASFEIKIQGLDRVGATLRQLPPSIAEQVQRVALRQGANYMLKAIRAAAPVKTGRLKRAIRLRNSKINRLRKNGVVGLYLSVYQGKSRQDEKGAWYAPFVERGYKRGSKAITGAQALQAGLISRQELADARLRARRRPVRSGVRFRRGGQAVPGQYFVRDTFRATRDQSLQMIVQASIAAVDRITQRMR